MLPLLSCNREPTCTFHFCALSWAGLSRTLSMPFDPVDPKQHFPDLELGIQRYWEAENIFQRSITLRRGGETFSFYDGPPFATGLPHYGHLLGGTIKDVIPRFQTMRGKHVERRFGWDCHGLPVEYEIEKEHGIKSRSEIEAMGSARFNELCRTIVQRYTAEWRHTVERMGRFVDMDHDYRTMDPDYMESIWWVFSELAAKNLLQEGYKPMHVCPRCATPLSNFEVTQGYRDTDDIAATVAFRSRTEPDTFFLAWTTTPWTLPGNLFLAVHPDTLYTKVVHKGKTYILAEPLLERIFKDIPYEKIGEDFAGSSLIGHRYEPLFPFFADQFPTAFRIVAGAFVTTDDGTGIVHIAPGYGEDDYRVGQREGVEMLQHVTLDGHFVPAVTDFAGMEAKPKDEPTRSDKAIVAWLKEHDLLFQSASYRHSYPHCWRCESPLLNYATSSWFVAVENIKDAMIAANNNTEWHPSHLRDGRFGKWLEGARDWAISRNRYWGTPLPVWRTDDGTESIIVASRDDIRKQKPLRFTKVTAVRHGESLNNIAQVFEGIAPGSGLSAVGKKQATEAAQFLSTQGVDVIYCSPMQRAQETARALAKATGARIVTDERLTETGFGPHEGTTYDNADLHAMKARRMAKFATRDTNGWHHLEGMETATDMQQRVHSFLQDVLPRHRSDHIVVVSHGAPIMQLRSVFTREDPYRLSVLPLPRNAAPESYFWDHDSDAQFDLHKQFVDAIQWPSTNPSPLGVRITAIRHGETDWNKDRLLQGGDEDIPLNDAGRAQAAAVAASLKREQFDAIVCSPMARATETAQIIATALQMKNIVTLEGLRERCFGDWSGKNADSILTEHPLDVEHGTLGLHYNTPPHGESLSTFLRRIEGVTQELLARFGGKKILVISHRGTMAALRAVASSLSYREACATPPGNCSTIEISLQPFLKRIPEVLDCWFESGSMPYAQEKFPYRFHSQANLPRKKNGAALPRNFPADFIAEGIDQTRGWFYTLTVLGTALFGQSPFKHCVVNGTVLAEDGRKMSKRLKNYPEPQSIIDTYGADALRFALMSSPAVRADDMRFSDKAVQDAMRNVILPLWNSYSFFVTYASLAAYEPSTTMQKSTHPLDVWLFAELQDLTNRMTDALESYDLSGACAIVQQSLDGLTNWYIRLSRRRFAGKGSVDAPDATSKQYADDQRAALDTLFSALLTYARLLAPFTPFVTDALYLNLTQEAHGSVHLSDWPVQRTLQEHERAMLRKTTLLRRIVSLGMTIRSEMTIKVRTPLQSATIALPPAMLEESSITTEDRQLLMRELNVKDIAFTDDPGALGERTVQVNARRAGPRLGKKVQEVIAAGKRGAFIEHDDGTIEILGERLTPEEAPMQYRAAEGQGIAAEAGVIVSLDITMNDALLLEGDARELIRHIQQQRKDSGLSVSDVIVLDVRNADALIATHGPFILQETNATLGSSTEHASSLELECGTVHLSFHRST